VTQQRGNYQKIKKRIAKERSCRVAFLNLLSKLMRPTATRSHNWSLYLWRPEIFQPPEDTKVLGEQQLSLLFLDLSGVVANGFEAGGFLEYLDAPIIKRLEATPCIIMHYITKTVKL